MDGILFHKHQICLIFSENPLCKVGSVLKPLKRSPASQFMIPRYSVERNEKTSNDQISNAL